MSGPKLNGDRCQCSGPPYKGCGEYFNSTFSFDAHRIGPFKPPGQRRCMTREEMLKAGMKLLDTGWRIVGG